MRIAYLSHSVTSCWNHGNAHFQRGLLRALIARGHPAIAWEPQESWSRSNLLAEQGGAEPAGFADLVVRRYRDAQDMAAIAAAADAVIVHEWTDPAVVAELGRLRRAGGAFVLLFHDTHHRAVSAPAEMQAFDLSGYDAVLAFGATLAAVYESWGWPGRAFVFHEAADTRLFRPLPVNLPKRGAVWIGNWGDGERTAELEAFLLRPAQRAGVTLDVHGVRYPPAARALLQRYGARYHGWLANTAVPDQFARHAVTVHVPRGYYTRMLPGIPTIRVFEALACGIPLISSPWDDCEGLFRAGEDYLVARDTDEMEWHMRRIVADPSIGAALAASGLARIRARHSCDHRAGELLQILDRLAPAAMRGAA